MMGDSQNKNRVQIGSYSAKKVHMALKMNGTLKLTTLLRTVRLDKARIPYKTVYKVKTGTD